MEVARLSPAGGTWRAAREPSACRQAGRSWPRRRSALFEDVRRVEGKEPERVDGDEDGADVGVNLVLLETQLEVLLRSAGRAASGRVPAGREQQAQDDQDCVSVE